MAFNFFSFVRISQLILRRKKPIRTTIRNFLETLYSYGTIPQKVKILKRKIDDYNDKIDEINNEYKRKLKHDRKGNYLNTLR